MDGVSRSRAEYQAALDIAGGMGEVASAKGELSWLKRFEA
jgi:hypothetical protein